MALRAFDDVVLGRHSRPSSEVGQLTLKPRMIETVRADAQRQERNTQRAERLLDASSPAGHIVEIHRSVDDDVAICIEASGQLLAVVVEV